MRDDVCVNSGNTPETRGSAFVIYEDIFDAKNACDHLSGFNVCNRYLVVLYYQPNKVCCLWWNFIALWYAALGVLASESRRKREWCPFPFRSLSGCRKGETKWYFSWLASKMASSLWNCTKTPCFKGPLDNQGLPETLLLKRSCTCMIYCHVKLLKGYRHMHTHTHAPF